MKSKKLYILPLLLVLALMSSCSSQKDNGCGYWGATELDHQEIQNQEETNTYRNHSKIVVSE